MLNTNFLRQFKTFNTKFYTDMIICYISHCQEKKGIYGFRDQRHKSVHQSRTARVFQNY